MKKILIGIVFILILSGCRHYTDRYIIQRNNDTVLIKDTCYVLRVDTLYIVKQNAVSLKQADAVSTLTQIQYYENIINRNPSQKKYEHGWITRALKYYNFKKK